MKHLRVIPASIIVGSIVLGVISGGYAFRFESFNWFGWILFTCWYLMVISIGYGIDKAEN